MKPELVIVGSVGLDTIETPTEPTQDNILGGSASYACMAGSFFAQTGMVGIVGSDFPEPFCNNWEAAGIDLAGLQKVDGKTFAWHGVYEANMDNRSTVSTELGVFETFSPELPADYCDAPFLFLGNIAPALQLHVLEQVHSPKFILVDTMDLWINIAKEDLIEVIKRVDMLTLNESEARLLTGEHTLPSAAKALLALGPDFVLIKKGESGSMLFCQNGDKFLTHAYPLEQFKDPTGAGDTFAGALMGKLASLNEITPSHIHQAMAYGSVVASFGVEEFSLNRLQQLDANAVETRHAEFLKMTQH